MREAALRNGAFAPPGDGHGAPRGRWRLPGLATARETRFSPRRVSRACPFSPGEPGLHPSTVAPRAPRLSTPHSDGLRIAPHSQDDPRIRAALKAREPPATDSMLPGVARFSMGVAVRDGAARTRKGGHGRTRKSSPAARIYYSAAVNDRSNGGATRPGGRGASSTARRLESTTPPARGQGVIV